MSVEGLRIYYGLLFVISCKYAIQYNIWFIIQFTPMTNNDRSNRSLLALAGQRFLQQNLSMLNPSKIAPKNPQPQPPKLQKQKQKQRDSSTRKLMMKLTLPRLRKMQALVRGFLVRRTVYPGKLEKYLIAKSILGLVCANVVYREASEIILESVTYIKYERQPQQSVIGYERMLENEVCNRVIERVFRKEAQAIVQSSVTQFAQLLTRPRITFGFNLRDPLQLLLFDTINSFVGTNYKQIVRQAIQECVYANRELRVIDEWIQQFGMLTGLYQEIVNEALNESIGEYIVENMINRLSYEGAEVVARVCFDDEIQQRKERSYGEIQKKMVEWILQEGSLKAIIGLGHSIDK